MDMPKMNRKEGKMQSAGVIPFHALSKKGEKTHLKSPVQSTIIIIIMVNPLKISTHKIRFD